MENSNIVKLNDVRCVVLSDIHQDIEWVDRVLFKENPIDSFDYVIINGDWFDTHQDCMPSLEKVCNYIDSLIERLGDRLIVNVGNHDIPYYYAWYHYKNTYGKVHALPYPCSGYNNSKARIISKCLKEDVIKRAHLVVFVNGHLISHAGVLPNLFPYFGDDEDSDQKALNKLLEDSEKAWRDFRVCHDSPFFGCGPARGGDDSFGGVLWADWHDEFFDGLPYPQIVGHTIIKKGDIKKGRCWNLDGGQTRYAILHPSGDVEIKFSQK